MKKETSTAMGQTRCNQKLYLPKAKSGLNQEIIKTAKTIVSVVQIVPE